MELRLPRHLAISAFIERLKAAKWDHATFVKKGGEIQVTIIEFADNASSTLAACQYGNKMFNRAGYVPFETEAPTAGQLQGMIMLVGHLDKDETIADAADHWQRFDRLLDTL